MEWVLSFLLLTPVDWAIRHDIHHGRSGNLAGAPSEWNDTVWFTKKQYFDLPEAERKVFALGRNPFVFFLLGPILLWEIQYRLPWIKMSLASDGNDRPEVFNSVVNTIGSFAYMFFIYQFFGGWPLVTFWFGTYFAQMTGILLFHSQHSFNPAYNVNEGWNRKDSAFKGSSFQQIPSIFKYWFMGIEYHHIHHYSTKVPGYLLQQCHEEGLPKGLWDEITYLTYSELLYGLRYTLYDEENERFISFGEAHNDPLAEKNMTSLQAL